MEEIIMREETRVTIEERMQDIRNITEEVCDIIDKEQYEDFKSRMLEEYQARTGKELIINSVVKNSGVIDGFVMKIEGSGVTPNVYAEPLYQLFKVKGFEVAYNQLIEIFEANRNTPELDLEFKPENLILQVIGSKNNRAIMKESPYKAIEGTDLICIYKWVVGEDERGICSTRIKHEDLERFGLANMSEEELYSLALENIQRMYPGIVKDMFEMIGCVEDIPSPEEIPVEDRMWVVTNNKGINGATSIIYENILKGIAGKIGGDFYIIPSSIHEVLCISAKNRDAEPLKTLVGEVNGGLVENHERLSYNVYLYEVETDSIRIAA